MALSNLQARFLTGLIGGSAFITLIWVHPVGLWFLCMAISVLCLVEFFALMDIRAKHPALVLTLAGVLGYWALLLALQRGASVLWLLLALMGVLVYLPLMSILMLFRKQELHPFRTLANLLLGLFYVLPGLSCFFFLGFTDAQHGYQPLTPLGVVMMFWMSDTAAYFAGRALGKHKLMPRVSPNKSWEGAVAGFLAPVALGIAYQVWMPHPAFHWGAVGVLLGILSPIGDLVESLLKRNVGAKDAGSILPGHGGLLDRFDGLLVALPILTGLMLAYWLLEQVLAAQA